VETVFQTSGFENLSTPFDVDEIQVPVAVKSRALEGGFGLSLTFSHNVALMVRAFVISTFAGAGDEAHRQKQTSASKAPVMAVLTMLYVFMRFPLHQMAFAEAVTTALREY
jgi:hypothetical protein